MTGRFPNFRRAQVERGPYYRGPARIIPFRRAAPFLALLAVAVAIGFAIGWNA